MRLLRPLAAIAALCLAGGCRTIAWDSIEVPGTNQRLVIGAYDGAYQVTQPRIWVYEDGKCTKVEIRDESGGYR